MKKALLATLVLAFVAGVGATEDASAADEIDRASGITSARTTSPGYMTGNGPMSSTQRGDFARDFVRKWGAYFHTTYQQPVDGWAQKQALIIAGADAQNLRRAMRSTTLEAAMMALRGHQVSDDEAIDFLARQPAQRTGVAPTALGDLAADLVYTPVTPCRVLDTRVSGIPVGSGVTRSFFIHPGTRTGFELQGGKANTDCGMIPGAAAVAINIAAPLPQVGGFLTVFPFSTSRPLASNLDYTAGELKNNEMVVRTGAGNFDISIYAHGQTHVVGDVVGYYAAPAATALECITETNSVSIAANAGGSVFTGCAAGYRATGVGGTWTSSGGYGFIETWPSLSAGSVGWTVWGRNQATSSQILRGYTTCCRVPGR